MQNYSKLPNLLTEIVFFFRMESNNNELVHKQVFQFCSFYSKKYDIKPIIQPKIIDQICNKMYQKNILSLIKNGTTEGIHNEYLSIDRLQISFEEFCLKYEAPMKMSIFGFQNIVDYYSDKIFPLLHTDSDGDTSVATAFAIFGGIVTAKHCIDGAKQIAIKSITKEQLMNSDMYTHTNDYLDLLFIKPKNFSVKNESYWGEPYELEEVLTIGYPRIPGFTHFMTKEKATVSALPSSRVSKSLGSVAAIADEIFAKEALFLITAKIRGGNSGGPVINADGAIVGVSTQTPLVNTDDYDDLGYGVAVPTKFVREMVEGNSVRYDKKSIEFIDFIE